MSRPLLAEYVRHGWKLTHFRVGEKGPEWKGWNRIENAITDPDVAQWIEGNVGLMHAYSGTCCVDVDDLTVASPWLAAQGIDLDELTGAADSVMISSGRENRTKLLYATPLPLPSFKLPGFELRCGTRTGRSVQDVLPPSIHPLTKKPYEWAYGCEAIGDWTMLPALPQGVALLWRSLITPETKIVTERAAPSDEPANMGTLRTMLYRWDPDIEYPQWVEIGMSLHYETNGEYAGLALWDEWSARSAKYKGKADLETHWRSFTNIANPRTGSSLRVDEPADPEEFPLVTPQDVALSLAQLPAPVGVDNEPLDVAQDAIRGALNTMVRDKSGKALATLPNLVLVLDAPEVTGTVIAYDEFKDQLLCAPHKTDDQWRNIKDADITSFRIWMETTVNFNPVGKDMMRDSIYHIGEQNKMDTAQKWLKSLQWDGKPRVARFFCIYMGTIDAEYERAVALYVWTALAGRVMQPGCQADMIPILVGNQGMGKSQGIKAMAPHPDMYVEIKLDEPDDVIARKMRGKLVGELAELRGLNKADQDRVKAFVVRTHEEWTPKYMEFAQKMPRRLVMIGSVNEDEILTDDENRRWLPLRVSNVEVERIKADCIQLWAEAYHLWKGEGIRWREAENLGKLNHDEFRVTDSWEHTLREWLVEHPEANMLKMHDVLTQGIGLDIRHITRVHELRTGKVLRELGYDKKAFREEGKVVKYWVKRKSLR